MEHLFTPTIKAVLMQHFKKDVAEEIFKASELLQYINFKTASAGKSSKSRSIFGSIYAVYILIEDYLNLGYNKKDGYSNKYQGAVFSDLFQRQRELPFGKSLQNHALNTRMNGEFEKFFPNSEYVTIIRNQETNRYWINENLFKVTIGETTFNIALSLIEIINEYMKAKQDAFKKFISQCEELQKMGGEEPKTVHDFIMSLLAPNVDARLFEIVSYSILKY